MPLTNSPLLNLSIFFILLGLPLNPTDGQESWSKVTNLNYGFTGNNTIKTLSTIDEELFVTYSRFSGDNLIGGIIATLSPDHAPPLGVLKNAPLLSTHSSFPQVFKTGEKTFAITSNPYGFSLHNLEGGEETLLHTFSDFELPTQFVSHEDQVFFFTASTTRQIRPGRSTVFAPLELWKTNGTSAGTTKVISLPNLFSLRYLGDFAQIVAGESGLLLCLGTNTTQQFYYYSFEEQALLPLSTDQGILTLGAPPYDQHRETITFKANNFYVWGKECAFCEAELFTIAEASLLPTQIPVPELTLPDGDTYEYNQLQFVHLSDSLLVLATRVGGFIGTSIYAVPSGQDQQLTSLVVNISESSSFRSKNLRSTAIVADTLYYQSIYRDSIDILAFNLNSGVPELVTRLKWRFETSQIFANDTCIYVIHPRDDLSGTGLVRINKQNKTVSILDANVGYGYAFSQFPEDKITVTSKGIYFIAATDSSGLYSIANTSDTPVLLESSSVSNSYFNIPKTYNLEPEENGILISTESGDFLFDTESEETRQIELPNEATSLGSAKVGAEGQATYFLIQRLGDRSNLYAIRNGRYVRLSLSHPDGISQNNYSLNYRWPLSDGRIVFTYIPDANNTTERHLVIGEVSGNQLIIKNILPGQNPEIFNFYDDCLVVKSTLSDEEVEYHTYDYDGEHLYQFRTASDNYLRFAKREGAFVDSIDQTSLDRYFFYHSAEGEERLKLNHDDIQFLGTYHPFYNLINNELVIQGSNEEKGKELYIFDLSTDSIKLIKDINLGYGAGGITGFSTDAGMIFPGNTEKDGVEPWFTDGTEAGTFQLADIFPGSGSSYPSRFFQVDDNILFSAQGPLGYEVYRLNLASFQVDLLFDLHEGAGGSHPEQFKIYNDFIYFMARSHIGSTYELYRINKTLLPTESIATRQPAKVFPNPVRDRLLTITAPEGESLERLQLFNQQGQLLREVASQGPSGRFDLAELPAGTYWLRSWYASGRFSINAVQHVR